MWSRGDSRLCLDRRVKSTAHPVARTRPRCAGIDGGAPTAEAIGDSARPRPDGGRPRAVRDGGEGEEVNAVGFHAEYGSDDDDT